MKHVFARCVCRLLIPAMLAVSGIVTGMTVASDGASAQTTSRASVVHKRFQDAPDVYETGGMPIFKEVNFSADLPAGSIVIDQKRQYVYLVLEGDRALEYRAGVGRIGREMSLRDRFVSSVVTNPEWPVKQADGSTLVTYGPASMLGPFALRLALVSNGVEGGYALHGTNRRDLLAQPDGQRHISDGCIRLLNAAIVDLKARVGARVYIFSGHEVARFIHGAVANPREVPIRPAL